MRWSARMQAEAARENTPVACDRSGEKARRPVCGGCFLPTHPGCMRQHRRYSGIKSRRDEKNAQRSAATIMKTLCDRPIGGRSAQLCAGETRSICRRQARAAWSAPRYLWRARNAWGEMPWALHAGCGVPGRFSVPGVFARSRGRCPRMLGSVLIPGSRRYRQGSTRLCAARSRNSRLVSSSTG